MIQKARGTERDVAFSNIHGLTQLRFPRHKIGAVFEDVRRILEREGIVA
jgi:hypothetical protein